MNKENKLPLLERNSRTVLCFLNKCCKLWHFNFSTLQCHISLESQLCKLKSIMVFQSFYRMLQTCNCTHPYFQTSGLPFIPTLRGADGMENVEIIYVWTLNRVVEELPSSCPQDF
jgi:hypothetical protein